MLKVAEVNFHLFVEDVGKCEHCGELFADVPSPQGGVREDKCPRCGGELTAPSFGHVLTDRGFERTQWIGPEGEWVREKPRRDFQLGGVPVVVNPPLPF